MSDLVTLPPGPTHREGASLATPPSPEPLTRPSKSRRRGALFAGQKRQASVGLPGNALREQLTFRRRQKRQQVWVSRLQHLVKFGLFIALALLIYQAVRSFPLYANSQVQWMGPTSQLIASESIERQLAQEQQFLFLDVKQVANELKDRFPLLAHVEIRRRFFPEQGLMVSVAEKPLWGLIYRQGERLTQGQLPLLVVSSDNLIFPVKSLDRFVHYQQAHQDQLTKLLIPSHRQEMMTAFQLAQLHQLAETLKQYPLLNIQYLDLSQPDRLALICEGPDVYLGRLDETWEKRIKRLASLLPHWKAWTGKMEAVDLRWENQVTLHPVRNTSSSG